MWTTVAAFLWTLMVFVGSIIPANQAAKLNPLAFIGADKLAHFGAYLMMMLLWSLTLSKRGSKIGGARVSFYGTIALGILLEVCQSCFFESRSFEIVDIIANIMGSIVGLVLFYKFF